MRPWQSETSTNNTPASLEGEYEIITMPPSPNQQEWIDAAEAVDRIRRNATPTSPGYTGATEQGPTDQQLEARQKEAATNAAHNALTWTACYDDGCLIHKSDKDGAAWYPSPPTRTKPCEQIRPWDQCFRASCRGHINEKIKAGYYPQHDGTRKALNAKHQKLRKYRETVRTRLEKEEAERKKRQESVETTPDVDALHRQITNLGMMLDEANNLADERQTLLDDANKTMAEQWQTIADLNQQLLTTKEQHRADREEARDAKRALRRLGREALRLGN